METNYFCINVRERSLDGQQVRSLALDRMVHSHSVLDDPTQLLYDYELMSAELVALRAQTDAELRALFVGGGGYTLPRYMEAVYPGSDLHVIEIDPGVTEIALSMLGVRPDTEIVSYNEDARLFLADEPEERFDLIFGDAFNDFSVPYHLTTLECNQRVRAWLADDGLYVINMIDGPQKRFLRAMLHTLGQTFAHVYLAPAPLHTTQEVVPRNTLVIVATDVPLEIDRLAPLDGGEGNGMFHEQLLPQEEIEALLAKEPDILTDDYAPVEQMLMPVFRDETE
jgi:spermidine synthase